MKTDNKQRPKINHAERRQINAITAEAQRTALANQGSVPTDRHGRVARVNPQAKPASTEMHDDGN